MRLPVEGSMVPDYAVVVPVGQAYRFQYAQARQRFAVCEQLEEFEAEFPRKAIVIGMRIDVRMEAANEV